MLRFGRVWLWGGLTAVIAFALVTSGCSSPKLQSLMPTPVLYTELDRSPLDHIPEQYRWKPRKIYFATTRERMNNLQRIDYGNRESEHVTVGLALIGFGGPEISWSDLNSLSRQVDRDATVDLSIAGLMEAGQFKPTAEAYTKEIQGAAAWLIADLNAAIDSARDQDLLIYVNGARVNFYNACVFAAQLDHFMGRDMTSLAFAWPSRQTILAYGIGSDVKRAYRSAPAFASLLEILARDSVARRIHIVSWSAGGRLVSSALADIRSRHPDLDSKELRKKLRIGTVYFAAGDVPVDQFIDNLPSMNEVAHRIIVTASSKDGALKKASIFMGGATRIGVTNQDLAPEHQEVVMAADRLEVIDVSQGWEERGFDITGHRYWFDHPWASTDLILSVRSDFGPEDRALEATENPLVWAIPEDYYSRLRQKLAEPGIEILRIDSDDDN